MLKRKNIMKKTTEIGIILFIIFIGGIGSLPHFARHNYDITVTDKQVKRHNDHDKYLIYTVIQNGQEKVFEDKDSLIELKFNSADVYGELKVNHKYTINTYGWRIPILSLYENITKVK